MEDLDLSRVVGGLTLDPPNMISKLGCAAPTAGVGYFVATGKTEGFKTLASRIGFKAAVGTVAMTAATLVNPYCYAHSK